MRQRQRVEGREDRQGQKEASFFFFVRAAFFVAFFFFFSLFSFFLDEAHTLSPETKMHYFSMFFFTTRENVFINLIRLFVGCGLLRSETVSPPLATLYIAVCTW